MTQFDRFFYSLCLQRVLWRKIDDFLKKGGFFWWVFLISGKKLKKYTKFDPIKNDPPKKTHQNFPKIFFDGIFHFIHQMIGLNELY